MEWMLRHSSQEEREVVIKNCNGDKAPTLAGFTMAIWGTVKDDITTQAFNVFHNVGRLERA